MSESLKQQLYSLLSDPLFGLAAVGITCYGSEVGERTDGPPPLLLQEADYPVAYLRVSDQYTLGVLDQRQVIQVRLYDAEARGYYRINTGLAICSRLFAPNRAVTYTDDATTETWWAPEPHGWSPETEDPDRPNTLLRWGEWAFSCAVGAAIAAVG